MQSEIEQIFLNVEKKILEDKTILEYISHDEAQNILKRHHKNIIKYIETSKIDTEFYETLDIPFIFIHIDFNLIRESLLKLDICNLPKQLIEKFFTLKSEIAKIYIKKDIQELDFIFQTPNDDNLLFKPHYSFLSDIIDSIQKENLSLFPAIQPSDCPFDNILQYPKSQMIINNEKNLNRINRLHTFIHKSANAFYLSYKQKQYTQAYFALKNLKEYVFRFIKILNDLYFETFLNIEETFFQTVEKLDNEEIYLSIIDIKNLKNFNLIYGERQVNFALQIIQKRVEKFMKEDYKRTLTIKANSADFFMLNIDYPEEEYKNLLKKMYRELNKPIYIENAVINLPVIIGGIKISKNNLHKDKILHSLIVLKNMAKKENVDIKIITSQKQFEELIKEDINTNFIIDKLKNKEIDIMFQPIYETKSKKLFSLEVLGRIKDNNKLLPAGMFIDQIYEYQLIEKFDLLILEKLIEYEEQIKHITNKIFLNISFQSLLNEEYMVKLKDFLEKFGIDVILELTEQKFVSDVTLIKEIYDKYKIHFAVDDFGTGYSSLQLVVELVELGILKILKIDGTLIKNLESNRNLKKIIELISKLGKDFKLLTVAEFVENNSILKHLIKSGIDLSQGYYLSKPKTIKELLEDKEKYLAQKHKNKIYYQIYGEINRLKL